MFLAVVFKLTLGILELQMKSKKSRSKRFLAVVFKLTLGSLELQMKSKKGLRCLNGSFLGSLFGRGISLSNFFKGAI